MTLEAPTFVNNFWGNETGFKTIQTKVKHSLETLEELLEYYQERVLIEKEFSKKLAKLNGRVTLGSHETGTLKVSLDKFSFENGQTIKNSNKFTKSVTQLNHDKLSDFISIYSKSTGKILHHMTKIISRRAVALRDLEANKEKYKQDAQMHKSLQLCVQTTWGKELEKHQSKLAKVGASLQASKKNYQLSLITYKELNGIFVRDWSIALQDIYKLEIEKIQCVKVNCFSYCNHIATLCVDNDQNVDLARSVFAQIQPQRDLQDFAEHFGTGNKIAVEPQFIDYMSGFDDDDAVVGYNVAQVDLPEYQPVLSKSYSQRSSPTKEKSSQQLPQHHQQQQQQQHHEQLHQSPQTQAQYKSYPVTPNFKQLPHVVLAPPTSEHSVPKTPSPTRKAPSDLDPKHAASGSTYSSSPDDLFEKEFKSSTGSNYSNPTNYSSNSERHWASPRRKEKQLSQVQEKINLKSKELPTVKSKPQEANAPKEQSMPIMKDFSIDFIAKALEDLNSGGNGDVSQYRRSVRRAKAKEREEEEDHRSKTAPTSPHIRPQSDYVNDRNEVATRYESISFTPREALQRQQSGHGQRHSRSKSMMEFDETTVLNPKQSTDFKRTASLSKSSTKKSYNNLLAIAATVTPITRRPYITKAKARYSYKPQHHGELFFKKGCEMYVIHKQEDHWYLCELANGAGDTEGAVGLVPGNYLVEGDDIF